MGHSSPCTPLSGPCLSEPGKCYCLFCTRSFLVVLIWSLLVLIDCLKHKHRFNIGQTNQIKETTLENVDAVHYVHMRLIGALAALTYLKTSITPSFVRLITRQQMQPTAVLEQYSRMVQHGDTRCGYWSDKPIIVARDAVETCCC